LVRRRFRRSARTGCCKIFRGRDIKAIGNVIRHEHHRVDPAIVWSAVTDDLPCLKAAVLALNASHKI